jgi:hypothetical protein
MDTRGGCGTVIEAVAVWPVEGYLAVIVAVPAFTAVTTPAPLTVATVAAEEAKVELEVRSMVDESLKLPVTFSACVAPTVTLAEPGATAIEVRVGCLGAFAVDGWQAASRRPEQIARASAANGLTRLIRCLRIRCSVRR